MQTENIKITKLKLNPNNPRVIKDDKYKKLVKSIKDFPKMLEIRPIVVNDDMVVLGGNQRLKACKEVGFKEVPTIKASELTEDEQREFIIKDNIGFGDNDWDMLANEWNAEELEDWGVDLLEGWGESEPEAQEDDFDEEPPKEPVTQLGDLYEIGDHRLLCGDSTDSEQVSKLMNGNKANISFTSPPYNAGKSESLSGNTHSGENKYDLYDDNQKQDNYLKFLIASTNCALLNSNYLICNIQSLAGNKIALIEYLREYKNQFIDFAIWDKGHGAPAMAENVMTSQWEFLLFISSKQQATRAIPYADFRGTISNIHRDKSQKNNEFSDVHAATFPIHLPEWALQFTKQKDIILDQFLGTGTTMVASHQLKRKCYGMELDPKYCDVIVKRMIKLDPSLTIKRNGEICKDFE
mgnify:CR=1 FL=1